MLPSELISSAAELRALRTWVAWIVSSDARAEPPTADGRTHAAVARGAPRQCVRALRARDTNIQGVEV